MVNGLENVFIMMDDNGNYSINTINKTSIGLNLESLFEYIANRDEAIRLKNGYLLGKDHGFSEAKKVYGPKIVRATSVEYGDEYKVVCESCGNDLSENYNYCPYCGGHIEKN